VRARRKLWLLFTVFVLYGCTIPFQFANGIEQAAVKLHRLPLSPWIDPETGRRPSIPDTVQNILLFIPFGALGMLAGRRRTLSRAVMVTALGTSLSLAVETLQLFTSNRVSSLADVATNSLGALAGAAAIVVFHSAATKAALRLRRSGWIGVYEVYPLTVFSVLTVVALLQPFDVTLDVGTVAAKVHALVTEPWQFTVLRDEGLVVMFCCLLAMALAGYISALGRNHSAAKAAAVGVVGVCALEFSQLLITSRMPGLWDAAVASVGVVVGTLLWAGLGPVRSSASWRVGLFAMTAAAASLLMLSPFELSGQYQGFSWYPFRNYYERTTFEGLSHVIELGLAYFPLGYWLARGKGSQWRQFTLVFGLALLIAGPLEYLQGWIVGRFPDISDIGLSLAGGGLGLIARQEGNRPIEPKVGDLSDNVR